MRRESPFLTRFRARRLALAAALLLVAGQAAPATYYVDTTGADDAARDGLSLAAAWRTLTFAVSQIRTAGPHEIVVGAGEYSEAGGETFPLTIPPDVSVTGAGIDQTVVHDQGGGSAGTLRWFARNVSAPAVQPAMRDLTIVRDLYLGQRAGAALEIKALDSVLAPVLTNLVLKGADRGLDLSIEGDAVDSSLSPTVDSCLFLDNDIGMLASSYTSLGRNAAVNPSFVNCVAMRNTSDGMVFETDASWDIASGARSRATSAPVITHCTLAENLGSGILLDNSNGYLSNRNYWAGSISPRVTNSVLTGNGDYSLNEYTSSTDPAAFDRNLVGGNQTGLYFDEGTTVVTAMSGVPGSGNVNAAALFQRGLGADWHLRGDSPGIDTIATGFPPLDVDGEARPQDGDGNGTAAGDMGADEAPHCALNAVIDPAAPADRCGLEAPLLLSAAASAPPATFSCTQPLLYTWYADGVEAGTGPDLSVVPPVTTTYTVIVECPDAPHCRDAASVTVVVHSLPLADAEFGLTGTPTGDYEACIAWDATDVSVDLAGSVTATDPTAGLPTASWSSADGILLGGASVNAQLVVSNTGQSQDIPITLTAQDDNGCRGTSSSTVHVWRGPKPLPGGPYTSCQDVGQPQTTIPLDGSVDLATGSTATASLWRTDLGSFEDSNSSTSTLEDPRLKLTNFGFNRTANLTLTVTDDKGCSDDATTSLTLYWTPNAAAGGPYQEQEAATSPTTFALAGSFTGPPGTTLSWTTDLGTFESTGTQAADGAAQVLDVSNTGSDQLGQVCVTATPPSGLCPNTECTAVSVRTTPPLPPHDVGPTFRIDKVGATAHLSWENPPIDATHDRADQFDVWESTLPGPGGWAPRAGLQDVPHVAGRVSADDATLLDLAGPDLLFLKVVSENVSGLSCTDPATQLPDCPSDEDCTNGVDDDQDRRIDCADSGCVGIPPC